MKKCSVYPFCYLEYFAMFFCIFLSIYLSPKVIFLYFLSSVFIFPPMKHIGFLIPSPLLKQNLESLFLLSCSNFMVEDYFLFLIFSLRNMTCRIPFGIAGRKIRNLKGNEIVMLCLFRKLYV